MSVDEERITPKDAKDLIDVQKSLMLEQQKALEKQIREEREEFVEMVFQVPLSLAGKLSDAYAKLYDKWSNSDD